MAAVLAPNSAHAVRFRFPVDTSAGGKIFAAMVIGVDHDPEEKASSTDCLDHEGRPGFPFCYDQHHGTDFILEGGFTAMDGASALVVAAADGVVVRVVDGNYDRCHGEMSSQEVTCDGHPMRANVVWIDHPDGYQSRYIHLRNGSPMVSEGDAVSCGDGLGLIGSSGRSAGPHLHFEVHGPADEVVDPFAGPVSQPESLWVDEDGPDGLPVERCEGDPVAVPRDAGGVAQRDAGSTTAPPPPPGEDAGSSTGPSPTPGYDGGSSTDASGLPGLFGSGGTFRCSPGSGAAPGTAGLLLLLLLAGGLARRGRA